MESDHCVTQLIYGNGEFNAEGLDKFAKDVKLADSGTSYAVVAIMGPQSSGKSTLLNNLFQTEFREMDAEIGRSRTTQGIWMAKCVGIDPFTIAMDLEGSDGSERGQDDTAFEKKSALFALAIADIVMINMWCHDFGREQAANKPLLRTVFQAMMRLFGHNRKTTLLFVLRDKFRTPLERLKPVLLEAIQKIWDEIPKRATHRNTQLNQIFRVEVVALSSYERDEDMFKEEVAKLRREQFMNSTSPGGIAGDRKGGVPGSAFSLSAQKVWEAIKEDRDLDFPSHKVMLANIRCEEILKEKLNKLARDQVWLQVKEDALKGLVPDLGEKLSSILFTFVSEYESDTMDFDEAVRKSKLEVLTSKVLEVLYLAYTSVLAHQRSKVFEDFKVKLNAPKTNGEEFSDRVRILTQSCIHEFEKGCAEAEVKNVHWDASTTHDKLRTDLEAYAILKSHENTISDLTILNLEQQRDSQAQMDRLVELGANGQIVNSEPRVGDGPSGWQQAISGLLELAHVVVPALMSTPVDVRNNMTQFTPVDVRNNMTQFTPVDVRNNMTQFTPVDVCNNMLVHPRDLHITHSTDNTCWRWYTLEETRYDFIEVAELIQVCWLDVKGNFDTSNLSPGTRYTVVFLVMLRDDRGGWERPVNFRLSLPNGRQLEHQENFMALPTGQWIEIPVGEFRARPGNLGDTEILMYEHGGNWKTGLFIKGVAVLPTS